MTKPEIFRPLSNLVMGAFVILMAILFCVQFVVAGNQTDALAGGCIAAATVSAGWLIFIRPRLRLGEHELLIVNPLRTVKIDYRDITSVNNKFALTIYVGQRHFAIWVAPAPNRYSSRGIGRQEIKGLGIEAAGNIRAADSPRSASGVAAFLLRSKIDALSTKSETFASKQQLNVRFNYWGAAAVLIPIIALGLLQFVAH
jgi:hypothetical protein